MKPAELLAEELEQILGMLDILEVMHDRLAHDKPIRLDDLKRILQCIKTFVHKCHNKKEETVLFPKLRANGHVQNRQIVDDMTNENELAELYLDSLTETLNHFKNGDPSAKEKMLLYMEKYLALEKQHIHKEQIFVLPLCNQEIKKQDQLMNQFKLCDEHEFGVGMQEKFHESFSKVISSLKEQYYRDN